jgi:hypothetical protein
MRFAAILLLGVIGCASAPPSPFFHDDQYLRFGVDPDKEANAVIESQKQRDYRLAHRLVGQHFTALGFMDKSGRSTAVRILTVRGVGVALDRRAQTALEPARTYALLAPPIKDTHDADHDGFEEVFVEERTPSESCLRVYRVRDVGFIDPVIVDSQVLGQRVCPRSAVDLNNDGVVELWSEIELDGFPILGAALPRISLPLWANRHRFVARADTPLQHAWLRRERAQREASLELARKQLDVPTCYVLAVELAALAYLEGGDPSAQLAAYDQALSGLVLTPLEAAANVKARGRIFTDWNEPVQQEPAPRAVAASPPAKDPQEAVATPSRASKKTGPVDEAALQRALRAGAVAQSASRAVPAIASAPRTAPRPAAPSDEPVLAEGEFVITPESAAEFSASRRGVRGRSATPRTAAPATPPPHTTTPATTAPRTATPVAATPRKTAPATAAPRPATPATAAPHATTPATAAPRPATPATAAPHATTPAAAAPRPATPTTAAPRAATPPSPAPHAAGPASAAPATSPASPQPPAGPPPSASEWEAYRATAKELGNAATNERLLAAQARRAAANERREAQAARERATQAPDPATAAELRATVVQHVEAAQRYAEEANQHAATAAKHRAALNEHRALLEQKFGRSPADQ